MTSELFADDESVELSNNNNNNNKIILDWSNTKRIESLGIRAIQTTSRSRHSTTNVYKNKKKNKKKNKNFYMYRSSLSLCIVASLTSSSAAAGFPVRVKGNAGGREGSCVWKKEKKEKKVRYR